MKNKINKISFDNQDIFIGIDTHLKSWKVTIVLENITYKTFSMNPSAKELSSYLKNNFPGGKYYSAYEASFCGYSIHRELEENGITNIIANPADIPTTDKERQQKEDRRDSRKISKSLRNNELEAIYVPSVPTMEFRSLIRYRKTLVKEIARNKCRVKSFLYFNGINLPLEMEVSSKHWSGRFTKWLRGVEFKTKHSKIVLENLLDITEYLRTNLLKINKEIRKEYKGGAYSKILKLLCSIPGVGIIVAATITSELENMVRFKSLDKLCSYVGLIPRTNSSGERDRVGKITKRANKPLRGILIEAAWIATRNDSSLAYSFNELCKRMKKNEAIIRIAKKLLNRIRYVIKNEAEYKYATI